MPSSAPSLSSVAKISAAERTSTKSPGRKGRSHRQDVTEPAAAITNETEGPLLAQVGTPKTDSHFRHLRPNGERKAWAPRLVKVTMDFEVVIGSRRGEPCALRRAAKPTAKADGQEWWLIMERAAPPAHETVSIMGLPFQKGSTRDAGSDLPRERSYGERRVDVTPNLDILRRFTSSPESRELILAATHRVADGLPIVWASRLAGTPVAREGPRKRPRPKHARAAARAGCPCSPGRQPRGGDRCRAATRARFPGLRGVESALPSLGFEDDPDELERIKTMLRHARPTLVLVGLGFPKQEPADWALRSELPGTWLVGVGDCLSFPRRGAAARAGPPAATGTGVDAPADARTAPVVQALRRPGDSVRARACRLGAGASSFGQCRGARGVLLWSQNGGKSGSASATLVSLTESTKWMHQVVAVIPGQWYEASATVMVSAGEAETWISVLWYPSADGSGENMRNDESERTSSHNWAALSLGPVQAPAGARSVRFRLMVQAAFPAAVTFDEATFHVADPDADTVAIGPSVDVTPEVPRFDATPESAGIAPVRRGPMPTPKPPRTGSRAPSPRPCDICLSEVMSDPANEGRDAPFEWVEVHNTTAQPVDLGGWSIGDSKSLDTLAAPLLLEAGAYLVVAGRSAEFVGDATLVRVADGEIGDGLNNDGDTVRLLRSDGSTADALEYGPASDLPPATAGRSLAFDNGSGLWRTAAASPGGPSLSAPVAAASVPPTTFSPEPRRSYLPWIVLGVCVAVGVFTAPFAAKRLHKGASRASMGAWHLNGFRRFFRTSATLPGAKPKP